MKLQVNTSGAWKNVMEFEAPDVDIVPAQVTALSLLASERPRFRVSLDSRSAWATMENDGKWRRSALHGVADETD